MAQEPTNQKFAEIARELSESLQLNQRIIEALPGGIVHVNAAGQVLTANQEAQKILGLSYDALEKKFIQDFETETIREDGSPCPVEEYPVARALATGEPQPPMTIGVRRPDGRISWAVFTAVPVKDEGDVTTGAVVTFLDISARKRDEEDLRYSRERYRRLVRSSPVGIIVMSSQKLIFVNPAAAKILGAEIEDLIGRKVMDFVHPDYQADVVQQMSQLLNDEIEATPVLEQKVLRADGHALDVEVHGIRIYEDEPMILLTMVDISKRKRNEKSIRYLAYHDSLTGLGNRARLTEALGEQMKRLQADAGTLAVFFLDLDRLKLINDTLGHSAGDWVIRQVARRIESVAPDHAVLCRQGGDEFIILLPDPGPDEARDLARDILGVLRQPIDYREEEYFVSSSVGIALYPDDGTDGDTLLRNADAALYASKDRGRNTYTFAADLARRPTESDLNLNARMHRALENGDFTLFYQPILELDGSLLKWEALLRWPRPDGGFMAADGFIPLAEETGLIMAIDQWVLEQACREIQTFPGGPANVAVNLSPRQFESANFPGKVEAILERTGLAADRLVLESTERTLIQDLDYTGEILRKLDDRGVRISLDDFGTGYTSLGYLTRLPIASLKIDRSLIENVPNNSDGVKIVSAIVALGRNLNIEVIAEGVETQIQRDYLHEIECDALQGYLLGRPMAASQVADFLKNLSSEN